MCDAGDPITEGNNTMETAWTTEPASLPSLAMAARARARQGVLTKPAGSLGRLETLAIELASLQGREQPSANRAPIIIFAADHGVAAQGVSAFPAAVTVQMLANFVAGGAAISVLARALGVPVSIVDVGTLAETEIAGVVTDKPRRGTRDFSVEPAMTRTELAFAIGAGRRAVERVAADGADLLILGEMGIGNTTAATAILAALTGLPVDRLVGAGTGVDAAGIARKVAVIGTALARHDVRARPPPPMRVFEWVGGYEIAALTGAMLAAAQRGIPVLVDGFIVSVAALAATMINPSCRSWLLFAHRSAERGHTAVLDALDAEPILDLGLRLGEASGAAVALPMLRLACALHNDMATFEQAAVAGRSPS